MRPLSRRNVSITAHKLLRVLSNTPPCVQGEVQAGTVTYFCRSRGHGFLRDDRGEEHFVHVSDVESDFVPLKGDKVRWEIVERMTHSIESLLLSTI